MQAATAKKTKWQVKRETSYEALVDSAMRRFHDLGYAATRVEDIVEGTGYTGGAFYFHFKSKADCFWHVIEHRQRRRGDWASTVTRGLDPATTSLEEVLARVFARFAEAEQGISVWVLVMVDFFQQHRDDPEAHARLTAVYERWHAEIEQFVVALQRDHWVATERDAHTLTTQLLAATEGLTAHARMYALDPATVQRALIDMLVRLLKEPA
jgi:TetR/AcrR family transcriptional repressor of nem operon